MDGKILQILNRYRDQSTNGKYTHGNQMMPSTGKFLIERKNMEEFMSVWCDRLWVMKDDFLSGIGERASEYMPILVDVDIKLPYDEEKTYDSHLYTRDQVETVIKIYMRVLKELVHNLPNENLNCILLEKSKPTINLEKMTVKSGFHLHFPFLFLHHTSIELHIYPKVKKEMDELKIFENLGFSHSGETLDKGCCKPSIHWLMYGSRKDIKLEFYKYSTSYNYKCEQISLKDCIKDHYFYTYNDDNLTLTEPYEYHLPRILSIQPLNRPDFRLKPNIVSPVIDKMLKAKDNKEKYEGQQLSDIITHVKRLMEMIRPSRADNYEEWIYIGWMLYNVCEGCKEGMDLWIKFSEKTRNNNFDYNKCVWEWNYNMERRGMTLGTLKHFAEQDNPELYKAYRAEENQKHIDASLKGGQHDIAKMLHDMFGDKYVCADIESGVWYEFKNHKWSRIQKGVELRIKIITDILPLYVNEGKKNYELAALDTDANSAIASRMKQVDRIIGSLKSNAFNNGIMAECQYLFYDSKFLEKLDKNEYYLCFQNGVLDLHTCEFRDGKPSDFCSLYCKYDFKEFDDGCPEIADLKVFLIKIFPDPQLRRYFMEYCARLLRGKNFAKTFVVMTGEGDNGKSVTIDLLFEMLGMYAQKMPTTLLTGKPTQSSGASPELARTMGIRFCVAQEPDSGDTINGGKLKEMTGNDSFYARGLHKDPIEIVPQFKLALICNKLPHLGAGDQAIWNRVRVLPFESRFPKNNAEVPLTWEEQIEKKTFYRDATINEKFDNWKQAFMYMCFQTYKDCSKKGWMPDPPKVLEATNAYRANNDKFLQYVNECIIQDNRVGIKLSLNEVYNNFKNWYSSEFAGQKAPTKNELREDFEKRFGKIRGQFWIGFRLKTSEDLEKERKIKVLRKEDFTDTATDESATEATDDEDF